MIGTPKLHDACRRHVRWPNCRCLGVLPRRAWFEYAILVLAAVIARGRTTQGTLPAMTRPRPLIKDGLPPKTRASGRAPRLSAHDAAAEPVRLQKFLASAGVGSRRHCEELITSGRVEVEGSPVIELGSKVLPGQHVTVDGVPVATSRHVYFLVNKPQGVVSTNDDPAGRTRVVDLLPPTRERLFTVGRLDMSSEGLMLVTNDGDLANRLAHPRYGIEKTYQVLVAGSPDLDVVASLRRGVHLAEGVARATSVRVKKSLKQSTLLEIVLCEGKNREIRRVLAKVGHKVLTLKRIAIGPLRLADMAPGEFRRLTGDELRSLRGDQPKRPARPRRRASQRSGARSQVSGQASGPGQQTRPAIRGRKGRRR
jgi:23S rRNA pseudouridine2605 synthase